MIRKDGMVIMTEEEYNVELGIKVNEEENSIDWKAKYNELLSFLPKIVSRQKHEGDIQLRREDFIKLWFYGEEQMDLVTENFTEKNNLVYDNDMEVHWMGYFCNCFDGATVANYIIPAIQSVDDELDGRDYTMDEEDDNE